MTASSGSEPCSAKDEDALRLVGEERHLPGDERAHDEDAGQRGAEEDRRQHRPPELAGDRDPPGVQPARGQRADEPEGGDRERCQAEPRRVAVHAEAERQPDRADEQRDGADDAAAAELRVGVALLPRHPVEQPDGQLRPDALGPPPVGGGRLGLGGGHGGHLPRQSDGVTRGGL